MIKNAGSPLRSSAFSLVALILLGSASAAAGPREKPERTRARELGYEGVEAYSTEDFTTADAKLEEAYRLVPVPSLGLWSARALVKLGKWVEAEQRYRSVGDLMVRAADSKVQRSAQAEAARERQELLLKIPVVLIELGDAGGDEVSAAMDGVRVDSSQFGREQRVNPGRHIVTGLRGAATFELIFELKTGERKQVWLSFAPAPAVAGTTPKLSDVPRHETVQPAAQYYPTLRVAGWIALVAGGAGLMTSSVAYLVGHSKYSELERRELCVNRDCPKSQIDAYNNWRAVHLAGLIGGSVLGLTGFSVLMVVPVIAKDVGATTELTFRLDSRTLTLSGTF